MKPSEKLFLVKFFHDFAQNAIAANMINYLQNVSWVIRRPITGRPSQLSKAEIFTLEKNVAATAEKIERLLENLNAKIISSVEE